MIFQYTWYEVVSGRKTQTRRVKKSGEILKPGTVFSSGNRVKWVIGRSYAVQAGRGKAALARIELIDIRAQRLGDMTAEDAMAEGFHSLKRFRDSWLRIHKAYDSNMTVWALEFKLLEVNEYGRKSQMLKADLGHF